MNGGRQRQRSCRTEGGVFRPAMNHAVVVCRTETATATAAGLKTRPPYDNNIRQQQTTTTTGGRFRGEGQETRGAAKKLTARVNKFAPEG